MWFYASCFSCFPLVVSTPVLLVVLMVRFRRLQVAEDLMEQLGVSQDRLVRGAYVDLLLASKANSQ